MKVLKFTGEESQLEEAAEFILEGKLVVFPTETVYGLGADALNERAVRRVFAVKGRGQKPLTIHLAKKDDAYELVEEFPEEAERLVEAFWPGPLTIILRKSEVVPKVTTAGLEAVGLRVPQHEATLKLIELSVPIVGPSANSSGRPSPTCVDHVFEDLGGKVDLVLDAGRSELGLESTVLDLTSEPPLIRRPGWLTKEELEPLLGELEYSTSVLEPKREISLRAELWLVKGEAKRIPKKVRELIEEAKGRKVGVLSHLAESYEGVKVVRLGKTPAEVAHNLYAALRSLEKEVDVILAEALSEKGIGFVVMHRLKEAATRVVSC